MPVNRPAHPVRRHRRRDEAGAIAVIVALSATMLFLLCALVVDLGLARDTRRVSQNAADASALAAGNAMYLNGVVPDIAGAVTAAKSYARDNYGVLPADWTNCQDAGHLLYLPDSTNQCISLDQAAKPTKVRVRMPVRAVRTTFGVVSDVQEVEVSAAAGATIEKLLRQPCGLCILGSGTHNFQNGDVTVAGADIYMNGSSDVSNQGLVATDGQIYVQNTASGNLVNYVPDPTTGVPALADPLAGLSLPPDMSGITPTLTKTNPCTQGPGVYVAQNLNNKVCTLTPGLYVIRAGTWDGSGNQTGELKGTGVTLYFTCSNGTLPAPCPANTAGAKLDASGNYTLSITAPTTGPLAGLAIVYDRNNTSMLRMTGNGSGSFTGAIYAKSSTLQVNGNGCSSTYNSMIVTNNVDMNGNPTCLKVKYDVGQNPEPPPGTLSLYQ